MRKLAYVHKIYLLILQSVSYLLFKILIIYKLHEIPYEKLHEWCKFYYTPMITYKVMKSKIVVKFYVHKPCFLMPYHISVKCINLIHTYVFL